MGKWTDALLGTSEERNKEEIRLRQKRNTENKGNSKVFYNQQR